MPQEVVDIVASIETLPRDISQMTWENNENMK